MRIFTLFFVFTIFISATVFAQTESSSPAAAPQWNPSAAQEAIQKNPFLKQLIDNGVVLHSIGNEQGFDGWVLTKDGQVQILYSRPDSDALLTGMLIGPAGENLTALQLARYEAVSGNSLSNDIMKGERAIEELRQRKPSEILFMEASQLDWLGYGASDNKDAFLYVFVNPESPQSRAYFDRLLSVYAKENLIQVRTVPYYTSDTGRATIIKTYSHPTPAKAFLTVMSGDEGVLNDVVPVVSMVTRLNKTTAYLKKLGIPKEGDSLTLYRDADSGIKLVRGTPSDLQTVILEATVQ